MQYFRSEDEDVFLSEPKGQPRLPNPFTILDVSGTQDTELPDLAITTQDAQPNLNFR